MASVAWSTLKKHQRDLIRKALEGSVFTAPHSAAAITALTDVDSGLLALPTGYVDLGFTTADGVTFGSNETTDETTSWGEVDPTRSDIVSRTSTLAVVAQETNMQTLGITTNSDLSAVAPPLSGEVSIIEAPRPAEVYYRVLSVAVDTSEGGDIYIARFFPRGKVTAIADQKQSASGETQFGLTFTAYKDDALAYAVRHFFGGPGWKALLVSMGFQAAASSLVYDGGSAAGTSTVDMLDGGTAAETGSLTVGVAMGAGVEVGTRTPAQAAVVPPKGGAGSGREHWAAYAAAHSVAVAESDTRDDIVAKLDAAGITTEA